MKKIVIFFAMIFLINFVMASFSIGNPSHSIETKYGARENVRGWINVSLINHPSDSRLESSIDSRSIKIIELLKANSNQFTCETIDCEIDYDVNNAQSTKTFSLNSGGNKLIAFRFFGENVKNIENVNFSITSNVESSCSQQIRIDVGDDQITDYVNTKSSNELCPTKNYGCFVNSGSFEDYNLRTIQYCQKITIPESPGLYAGAYIKKGTGNPEISMRVLYESGFEVGDCDLPSINIEGEFSCEINISIIKPEPYYVCIFADQPTDYKIRGNINPGTKCGFSNQDIQSSFDSSYQIFIQTKKFSPVGSFSIGDDYLNSLSGKISDFFDEKYQFNQNGYNCSNECIFPISIMSQSPQQITLSNLRIDYEKKGGQISENNFYDSTKSSPLINFGFQKINLDKGNFSTPINTGNHTLILKLDNQIIFNQQIEIEDTPLIEYIYPTKTAVNFATDFIIGVDNKNRTIARYEWNFGDGKSEITQNQRVTHTYNTTGNYTLNIKIIDDKSFMSSKDFKIEVGSAKEKINSTLILEKQKLESLKNQLENMPILFNNNIIEVLDLINVEEELKRIERSYSTASVENTYSNLLNDLIKINLPVAFNVTEKAENIIFFPDESVIGLDIISEIAGGEINDIEESDIIKWISENIEIEMDYVKYSSIYIGQTEDLLRTFKITMKPKTDYSYGTFLFFNDLENLEIEEDLNEKSKTGTNIVYIALDDNEEKTISFSTSSNVDFINLPFYISPSLSKIEGKTGTNLICNYDKKCWDNENWKNCSDCKPTGIIFLVILLILIIIVTGYILLYNWYKKHYERSLFRNQNDLYNIVNYIHNSKIKGLKDEEIKVNLRRSGWNGEQISYAIKKYHGKRTGMWHPMERY